MWDPDSRTSKGRLERAKGIEPFPEAGKASVLVELHPLRGITWSDTKIAIGSAIEQDSICAVLAY